MSPVQVRMDRELLRSGDRACVRFRFLTRPEYVRAVREADGGHQAFVPPHVLKKWMIDCHEGTCRKQMMILVYWWW